MSQVDLTTIRNGRLNRMTSVINQSNIIAPESKGASHQLECMIIMLMNMYEVFRTSVRRFELYTECQMISMQLEYQKRSILKI